MKGFGNCFVLKEKIYPNYQRLTYNVSIHFGYWKH